MRSRAASGPGSPTELELRTVGAVGSIGRSSTTVVTASDQFDNLTRRHTLTRTVDGRVEEVTVTDDEGVVKRWLTKWSRVPVPDTSKLDPARDYYVRVTTSVPAVRRLAPRRHQDHHGPGEVHVHSLAGC